MKSLLWDNEPSNTCPHNLIKESVSRGEYLVCALCGKVSNMTYEEAAELVKEIFYNNKKGE